MPSLPEINSHPMTKWVMRLLSTLALIYTLSVVIQTVTLLIVHTERNNQTGLVEFAVLMILLSLMIACLNFIYWWPRSEDQVKGAKWRSRISLLILLVGLIWGVVLIALTALPPRLTRLNETLSLMLVLVAVASSTAVFSLKTPAPVDESPNKFLPRLVRRLNDIIQWVAQRLPHTSEHMPTDSREDYVMRFWQWLKGIIKRARQHLQTIPPYLIPVAMTVIMLIFIGQAFYNNIYSNGMSGDQSIALYASRSLADGGGPFEQYISCIRRWPICRERCSLR